MDKLNLAQAFDRVDGHYKPKIAAELNGQHVKLARIYGDFIWHSHEDCEEFFYVVKGGFRMEFRDKNVDLSEGDMIVVPRGVEHRPVADEECWIMLFEPAGTVNTGEEGHAETVIPEWL